MKLLIYEGGVPYLFSDMQLPRKQFECHAMPASARTNELTMNGMLQNSIHAKILSV